MIRVLVVDDHPVVRRGLSEVLEESEIEVAGEAASADQTLERIARCQVDAIILDLSVPGARGLELLQRLRSEHPAIPVLVLSIYPEEQFALPCLKEGAAGYLTKLSAPEELVTAIRVIAEGRRYLSAAIAERLVSELSAVRRPTHETLSRREREVLCRLASGETVSEIAGTLGLSVKTVSTYRTRVLEKMGLRSNAEILRYALEHQLIGGAFTLPRL